MQIQSNQKITEIKAGVDGTNKGILYTIQFVGNVGNYKHDIEITQPSTPLSEFKDQPLSGGSVTGDVAKFFYKPLAAGTYTVKLVVKDSAGNELTKQTKDVTIS